MQLATPDSIKVELDNPYFMGIGDTHLGAPVCDEESVRKSVQWAIDNNCKMLLLGDIMDIATKNSKSNVYAQKYSPQEQLDRAIDIFLPAVDKGLVVGAVTSNHEWRVARESGLNLPKIMSDMFKVPFLGHSIFVDVRYGDQKYTIFGMHGGGGSTTPTGKLNKVRKLSEARDADVFFHAHTHELMHYTDLVMRLDRRTGKVNNEQRHLILTGAYLDYKHSYGEMKGYSPLKKGSPVLTLGDKEKKVDVNYLIYK